MFTRQRFVVVGVVALTVIVAVVLSQFTEWLWVQIGWDAPFLFNVRQLPLTTVVAYGVALIAGIVVLKHRPTFTLANEVVDELAKVSWPTREETGNATVVVIITVFICAAYLGAFDAVWLAVTDWILQIEPLKES